MHFRTFFILTAIVALFVSPLSAQEKVTLTDGEVNNLCHEVSRQSVSVHDPSVVQLSSTSKTFYIAGTMRGWARSTDNMKNWSALDNSSLFGQYDANGKVVVTSYENAFSKNVTTKVPALVNGQVQEVDFGQFDAKAWAHADQTNWELGGNMWAPDLIYNPNSKKWMMYFSLNGDDWHSVIVLLTADQITGPYVYQGPVHYSGFINDTNPAISYKKTDLEVAIGEQSVLPERYNRGKDWGTYWTNDIDPCVFFDKEGELWMTYGSWSGGIFILKMDKQTGLRDYTVSYPIENDNQGRALSDPYFGKRIAGGYYSSGEGSYIQRIGDYYYLFISYGGYAPDGGYEMRTFRSQTPDGLYLDAADLDACFHDRYWQTVGPDAQTNGGMKLMGAYNGWGLQTVGECAQGHNSATGDALGRNFVVYHTKFNDGTIGHQVRTRQLFLNEHGWLCAAPFQFDGETINDDSIKAGCAFTAEEMAGTYQVLIHKYKMNHKQMEEVTPITITLTKDGKVTGAKSGSWAMTSGTGYITLTLGGIVYRGVVVPQTVDGTDIPAIGITATTEDKNNVGVQLWAYHMKPRYAIAFTALKNAVSLKDGDIIKSNIELPAKAYFGATIKWTSSDATVINANGVYKAPSADTEVTLTCTITAENASYSHSYRVTAAAADDLPDGDYLTGCVAHYPFTSKTTPNQIDKTQRATFKALGSGTVPVTLRDAQRSSYVVHQFFGDKDNASYVVMDNPLNGLSSLKGITIAMWIKMTGTNNWDALWSFADKEANEATSRFFMTGNAYIGFNNGTGTWFDINHPNSATTEYLPADKWVFLVAVMNSSSVTVYVNGEKKAQKAFAGTAAYSTALAFLRKAPYLQLGTGSFWGSADCYIDDLLVYKRALSAKDVELLTIMAGRAGTDYTEVQDVYESLSRPIQDGVYDLSGRRLINNGTPLRPGLYVIKGRTIRIK